MSRAADIQPRTTHVVPVDDPEINAIVRLVNVHKDFGQQRVLRGVTAGFLRGKTTVVLGASGSGKSVMLKHILGLIKPDRGEVWFGDERVDLLSEVKMGPIRRKFGFLFQQSALFDSMNVKDNVEFPLLEHTDWSANRRLERVREVLALVGLADTMTKMPADLSGGQKKRVALARAIVLEPEVILYDEPTTGLDPIRSDSINELIIKLQRELHVTSIVVTHDLGSAFKVADTMLMMHEGRIVFNGTPEQIRVAADPFVHRFLMGEAERDEGQTPQGEGDQ